LNELDIQLELQNKHLAIVLEESNKKKDEVIKITSEQNEKVMALKNFTDEINREKEDTEKEKEDAIKQCEKLSNKDITEVSSYTNPPDAVSLCMKIILLLFDEEKDIKNKDDLSSYFFACKSKLLKNVPEFKEKLKKRLVNEEISERQMKKIELFYDPQKFETNYYESVSGA